MGKFIESKEIIFINHELKSKIIHNQSYYCTAKKTPKKIGHFATIWKRSEKTGKIMPFDSNDEIDFMMIEVSDEEGAGCFIFDKEILIKNQLITHQGEMGKLGIRVYAPWTKPIANLAIKTQKWQLKYFIETNTYLDFL